jgi:hypothetical protein
MALLSSPPNFSCSHKIPFASSDTNLKKPGDLGDMVSKPVHAVSPAGIEHGDTLVKSRKERVALIPGTPEEWTQHVLSQLPEQARLEQARLEQARTVELEKALHTHFQ